MRIVQRFYSLMIFFFIAPALFAQKAEKPENIYKINPYITASMGVVGTTTGFIGMKRLRDKKEISEDIVLDLNKNDVNGFDRWVLNQNPENRKAANNISDIGLYATVAAPVLLIADKRIRSHWFEIGLLYFETQSVALLMYGWSPFGPQVIDRYRPETYFDEIKLKTRQDGGNRNSFFSGHTVTTATSSFFMAKVICDFHPELGNKKWLVYSAALIPPAFVGYFRMRSLRHFPTDTMAATAIGAAIGILIPHLHKKKNSSGLTIGTNVEGNGVAMNLRF